MKKLKKTDCSLKFFENPHFCLLTLQKVLLEYSDAWSLNNRILYKEQTHKILLQLFSGNRLDCTVLWGPKSWRKILFVTKCPIWGPMQRNFRICTTQSYISQKWPFCCRYVNLLEFFWSPTWLAKTYNIPKPNEPNDSVRGVLLLLITGCWHQ